MEKKQNELEKFVELYISKIILKDKLTLEDFNMLLAYINYINNKGKNVVYETHIIIE